jgi:hypothetical protein
MNYQLQSLCSSQAAAGEVENATIAPMVLKPPNSNAVQMIKAFMVCSPSRPVRVLSFGGPQAGSA